MSFVDFSKPQSASVYRLWYCAIAIRPCSRCIAVDLSVLQDCFNVFIFLTNIGHRSKQVHFLTCLRHFYAVLQWNSGQPVRAPYTIIPLLFFVYYHFRLVIRGGVMLPCTLPNKRAAFI